MKEQRVNIKIKITLDNLSSEISSNVGHTISSALQPETKFLTSAKKISKRQTTGQFVLTPLQMIYIQCVQ